MYGGDYDQEVDIRDAVEDDLHIIVDGTGGIYALLTTGAMSDVHGVGFEDLGEDVTGFEETCETPADRMRYPGLIATSTDEHNLVHENPHSITGLKHGIRWSIPRWGCPDSQVSMGRITSTRPSAINIIKLILQGR